MSLFDHIEVFKQGAELNFQQHGEVLPVVAICTEGKIKVASLDFTDPTTKDRVCQKMVRMISQGKISEYLFVIEVWIAKVSDEEVSKVREWLNHHGTLESYPERSEAIMVVYCNPKKEIVYTAPIVRNRIQSSLGEWVRTEKDSRAEPMMSNTRFDNLFRKALTRQN